MDQPKQDRMLRLMKMMSGNINYTIEELSNRLEMSPRTIYRYIDTFKNSGYVVNKLFTNVYKIESVPQSMPDFDKLMYFSEEEFWTEESSHRKQGMDVFRMTGHPCGHIKLQMTVMAKNLLVEEYPLAEKEIVRKTNFWILDVDVNDYAGACRFYVGLADQIKIIDSPEFEEYVKNYLKKQFSKQLQV